jgi:hypothetical protein
MQIQKSRELLYRLIGLSAEIELQPFGWIYVLLAVCVVVRACE